MTHENLVSQPSQGEALYDILIYHSAVRLIPFVTMVTHSATVNHGGGLRKTRERVYANPCHYAQTMFASLAEAVPVRTELACETESAPLVLPDLRNVTKSWNYKDLDVVAAQAAGGDILISIVHKAAEAPTDLEITLAGLNLAGKAHIETLAADAPWSGNTLEAPEAITPVASTMDLNGNKLTLQLAPFSYTLVRIPR
jgi:alpha-N-arabinofuranosidase